MIRQSNLFGLIRNQENGSVAVIVAILIVVLLGFTALVIDVGQIYVTKRQMVSAADGGALAGAMEKYDTSHSHETRAREVAKEYAALNGAIGFDIDNNVAFTPPGGDERTIHVKACRPVEYTFARVLGFEDTIVCAVASVRQGPGNPLVPFVDIAFLCECDLDCECGVECQCDNGEEVCECTGGCVCICEGGVEYEEETYFIRRDDGTCAQPEDLIQLKHERWQDSGFSSGTYPYVRFPDQSGGNDLRMDIGGGYTGTIESVQPGTVIREEGGQTLGPLVQGLEDRLKFYDGENPTIDDYAKIKDDPYIHPAVVIVPMVHTNEQLAGETLPNKHVRIVGYASFLLIVEDDDIKGPDDKEVHAILIEYIDYERFQEILPTYMEGFVLKLVKTEGNPFTEVASY